MVLHRPKHPKHKININSIPKPIFTFSSMPKVKTPKPPMKQFVFNFYKKGKQLSVRQPTESSPFILWSNSFFAYSPKFFDNYYIRYVSSQTPSLGSLQKRTLWCGPQNVQRKKAGYFSCWLPWKGRVPLSRVRPLKYRSQYIDEGPGIIENGDQG